MIKGNDGNLLNLNLRMNRYYANWDYVVKLSDIIIVNNNGDDIASQKEAVCSLKHKSVGPDLILTDLSTDKMSYQGGETLNIKYNVTNVGDTTAEGWYESIRLRNSTNGKEIRLKNYVKDEDEIAAGQSMERSLPYSIPDNKDYYGTYTITYTVYGVEESSDYIYWSESSDFSINIGNTFNVSANKNYFNNETDKNEYYITLERIGDTSQAVDVQISCSADRLHIQNTVHFDAGETSVQIPFRVKNNNIIDESNNVIVTFDAPGYATAQCQITIVDDDNREYVNLEVSDISFDTEKEYAPGDEITITTNVANKGTKTLENGWIEEINIVCEGYRYLVSSDKKYSPIPINGFQQTTTTFNFPDMPEYGGEVQIYVNVTSLSNDEPSQYMSDNKKYSDDYLILKKVIEAKPEKTDFEELPDEQSVVIYINRSAYSNNTPSISASSNNGRVIVKDEKLEAVESCKILAYIVDNKKIEESDTEVLTINVDGYDEPLTITFNIKNDDIAMTEEHQLLQKFAEDEGLDIEGWEKPWDFSDGIISKHLDGVTFDDDMHVTGINLDGRNISGQLPRYLFDLPYIERLSLNGNAFNGKIEDVLGKIPAESKSLKEVSLDSNDFEGNLGLFASMLPPTVSNLHVCENRLTEVNPVLPDNIKNILVDGQRLGLEYELFISDINKEMLSEIPQIVMYDFENNEPVGTKISSYISTAALDEEDSKDHFAMNLYYDMVSGEYNVGWLNSDTHLYSGQSGDVVYWYINNVTCAKVKFKFKPGDCNFDDKVDATDIQATVLEAFDDYKHMPYNFTAGNTFDDEIINVQDVICTVNILLDEMAGTQVDDMMAKTRRYDIHDEEGVEARVYIADGKVMLKSDRKVAAFTIKSRGKIAWATDALGMTQATSDNGIVGYSLSGAYIPEGVSVLGTCDEDAHIISLSLSDTTAKPLKSAVGDGKTTGIGIGTVGDVKDTRIYDMKGVRQRTVRNGVYLLEKDGKVNKISINKR